MSELDEFIKKMPDKGYSQAIKTEGDLQEKVDELIAENERLKKRNREVESYHLNHLGIANDMTDPDIAELKKAVEDMLPLIKDVAERIIGKYEDGKFIRNDERAKDLLSKFGAKDADATKEAGSLEWS